MYNLNIQEVSKQLSEFCAAQLQAWPARQDMLARARKFLRAQTGIWHEQRHRGRHVSWLMATPLEDPTCATEPALRPTPLTAVASDGSQIFPDRHIEPLVYLLNISQIAFQYGTLEKPVMLSQTHVGSGHHETMAQASAGVGRASTDVVAARRDQMELEALINLAISVRQPRRPIVAMADGTLIRWMLQRIDPEPLKTELISRYAAQLAQFREHRIPLCSFISMPNSTEVVNLLRGLRGETEEVQEDSFAGILDRWLYDPILAPWQRTAVFASDSRVLQAYAAEDRICFFYVRVVAGHGESEISRVELPRWVAGDAELLDLVHATVVSECRKGNGYPMILAEAHEQAVIRTHDRTLFYNLVEREMAKYNLRQRSSRKRATKQRPVI